MNEGRAQSERPMIIKYANGWVDFGLLQEISAVETTADGEAFEVTVNLDPVAIREYRERLEADGAES